MIRADMGFLLERKFCDTRGQNVKDSNIGKDCNMRILFISEYFDEKGQGAYMVANSHFSSLCNIAGRENVDYISLKSNSANGTQGDGLFLSGFDNRTDKMKNLLMGFPNFYSAKEEKEILSLLEGKHYDLIWFDNCYFGKTIKRIKKRWPGLKVWAFYHGVHANLGRQTIRHSHYKPSITLGCINWIINEKLTTKYADVQILLNRRDESQLKKYTGASADFFLPVYYIDTAIIEKCPKNAGEFRLLFVGSSFWPNVLGITWFAENVMPYVDKCVKLYIVGRGMEVLREKDCFQNRRNIEVIGAADNLGDWYNTADIAVGPIFSGEGMKTKTAEALMYGKRYLGTSESLCGYEGLDDFRCDTAEEFIHGINQYVSSGVERFDPEMRKLYEKYYSVEAADRVLKTELQKRGLWNEG